MPSIRETFFTKHKNSGILLGILIVLFFLNSYEHTVFYRPGSVHQWRQADCLSITKNYYEEGLHFFQPKIHYQGVKDGKTVSECPLLNYTVACLWRVFGEHEFIYRLLEYFIFISSLFVLLKTLKNFLNSSWHAFFIISLVVTSPLIVYYDLNFIADVPAFSLSLMSFCFLFQFYQYKSLRFFYLSLVFGTLAVLMKASALLGLGLLLFFSLLDLFNLTKYVGTEKLFIKKTLPFVFIGLSIAIIASWYKFALDYNHHNTNDVFLLGILPIWEMNAEELAHNSKVLFNNFLLPWFLNKPMFFLFITLFVYVVIYFKKLPVFLKYSFVFSLVFFVLYFVFFFQVFNRHDYYLINLMVVPIITFMCFSFLIQHYNWDQTQMRYAKLFFVLLFVFNAINAAAMYRLRCVPDDKLVHWYPFISEEEDNLAKYLTWDYSNSVQRIENFTPELRKHGIQRQDLILSVPDISFNISLYFMDQKGYGITGEHIRLDSTVMAKFLNLHIKYLVMSDTSFKKERAFQKIVGNLEPFFIKGNVEVFKFKNAF